MPRPSQKWVVAFARQAESDRRVYEILCKTGSGLPACHRLHYLQMFLEKLVKAHLWAKEVEGEGGLPSFHKNHRVIAKALPTIIREKWRELGLKKKPTQTQMNAFREVAQLLDQLGPAVDAGGQAPENTEYPWPTMVDGNPAVQAPRDYTFNVDRQMTRGAGSTLLKLANKICADINRE